MENVLFVEVHFADRTLYFAGVSVVEVMVDAQRIMGMKPLSSATTSEADMIKKGVGFIDQGKEAISSGKSKSCMLATPPKYKFL